MYLTASDSGIDPLFSETGGGLFSPSSVELFRLAFFYLRVARSFFNYVDSRKCMVFKLFYTVNLKPCELR